MKKCVIIGAGASMTEGINKGLWTKLDNVVTFGLNESFQFFNSTLLAFVDWTFYRDRFDKVKDLPLVITLDNPTIGFWYTDKKKGKYQKCPIADSLIKVKGSGKYFGKEALKKGVYTGVLSGLFATTLGIALGYKEIFLLGFDMQEEKGKTHFYQDNDKGIGEFTDENNVARSGVGYNKLGNYATGIFNNTEKYIQQFWIPYLEEKDVKIYNVSMNSRINTFEKITYDSFFERIKNERPINQEESREEIRTKIQEQRDSDI